MVIAAIMFLTTIVVDFMTDSLRNHQVTLNYRARVQSYYLAKSAMNFSKLLLFYNKEIESTLAKKGISAADLGYQPLYKMLPISSEVIRGMLQAGSLGGEENTESEVSAVPVEAQEQTDEETNFFENSQKGISMLKQDEVKEFLDFTGDFDAEISEEMSKFSLNAVTKMTSSSSSYDLFKRILWSILMRPEFKNFFVNQDKDSEMLVHALSDFVDSNDSINEFDKVERGREESIYKNIKYKIKNAPYLTLSEIRLVAGMTDDIYATLDPFVTIYHTEDKINICLADEKIVDTLILYYTKYSECTTPIKEEDEDTLTELRDTILAFCPDKTEVAKSLNDQLGLNVGEVEDTGSTAETKSTSSKVAGCEIQFEDLITDANSVFRVKGNGTVNGIRTQIVEVLDTSASKPSAWKVIYYQVN